MIAQLRDDRFHQPLTSQSRRPTQSRPRFAPPPQEKYLLRNAVSVLYTSCQACAPFSRARQRTECLPPHWPGSPPWPMGARKASESWFSKMDPELASEPEHHVSALRQYTPYGPESKKDLARFPEKNPKPPIERRPISISVPKQASAAVHRPERAAPALGTHRPGRVRVGVRFCSGPFPTLTFALAPFCPLLWVPFGSGR